MGKIGWIIYSIIVIGLLVTAFIESSYLGYVLIIGLALGCWGGAMFPWDKFKD
jgi:hypothetical protein